MCFLAILKMLAACQGNPLLVAPTALPDSMVYLGCAKGDLDGQWTDVDGMRCTMSRELLVRVKSINFVDGKIELIDRDVFAVKPGLAE